MTKVYISPATRGRFAALVICIVLSGCAVFHPKPEGMVGFQARAVSKTEQAVTISAVALGPNEARAAFGLPTIRRGIQPVWVRVENKRSETLFLMPLFLDPLYFTPSEAAFINHSWLDPAVNAEMDALFQEHALPIQVGAGETIEGFLYVPPDLGAKALNFVYAGAASAVTTQFVVPVPGLDRAPVDFAGLYSPNEIQDLQDWLALRAAIEALPCCVTDRSGEVDADPLNFVIIAEAVEDGDVESGLAVFTGGGWDQAEGVTPSSAIRTASSFLFGSSYRYSPVSDLYVFGRRQDAAFQIARTTIDERNHLRVWLSPLRFQGRPVWVGAISRDIGVILSGLGTTHKIDPDVDAERWYLVQSLVRAQVLKRVGYAKGGPLSRPDNPRSSVEPKNIYYSDGLRVVMELSDEPMALDEITAIPW